MKVRDKFHLYKILEEAKKDANLDHLDVSGVTNMSKIFAHSSFNGDISRWDAGNVKNLFNTFFNSRFNGDISRWDVKKVKYYVSFCGIENLEKGMKLPHTLYKKIISDVFDGDNNIAVWT